MADFLVIRDFQTPSFRLKAGDVIDDANYPVGQLEGSGLLTIALTQPMLAVVERFRLARQSEELAGGDLLGALIFAGLVSLPMDSLSQRVIIESVSDLPTPSGGNHQLLENTVYQFNGSVTSPDGLRMPSNSMVIGESSGRDTFTYTGTGTAIEVTVTAGTLPTIRNLQINATSGLGVDVLGTVNFVINGCTINANEIATITVTQGLAITECLFSGFGRGITLSGTPLRLSMSTTAFFQATGGASNPCLDLGSTVIGSAQMSVLRCFTAVGGVAFVGLAATTSTGVGASPNISVGGIGKMVDSLLGGAGTSLSGITNEDIRWVFKDVMGAEDSVDLGDILITPGNTTVTTITDQGGDGDTVGWVRIAGTTIPVFESHLEQTDNNEITYNVEQPKKLNVQFCVVAEMSSGGTSDIEVGAGVNGTIDASTAVPGSPSSSERRTISCAFVRSFTQGDTVEVMIRNVSGTGNIIVHAMHFVVSN